ncbi:MAG: hypothetical protein IJZ73_01010 [Clostridia bacterium]|nr:hypothetical protein [Clostridia bacterium]
MKNDNTEYRLKLQSYSKFTILKISRIVTSVDRLHKVHSIVIRNDTEAEVIKELDDLILSIGGKALLIKYEKELIVNNYLQSIKADRFTIIKATNDDNLEKSYQIIQATPEISKSEFLQSLQLIEE